MGVSTLDGEDQLIGTAKFNLKGLDKKLLLFNSNLPQVMGGFMPLSENSTDLIGGLEINSRRHLNREVIDYIPAINLNRDMFDAILYNQQILVVLPLGFSDRYKLK